MRITIDIPDELLEAAMRLGGFETPQEAVIAALEEFVARARRGELVRRTGTFKMGMTREELLRWRRMGCGRERSEDEYGGETRADDS